ncbi:uncharacterized protein SPAPADRAFT_64803 [Spathaspora passalidarum NRRL Y-27907]|uniref:F-box domain-containing protein n=1 Tax=Spathaspora passalidarum (strain NRRL Y-27907 / 11-Y1) TaxID=619300 RepID=G3AEC8_SPAPN|nr:uncharacterized protein SPAPADRAFT_64803 [Spathaspora passalidarum NRRL Y-27907]EGW35716.1 hypothetical protein SPAPADRAFT_64803 [Spathaspora passalidarum NRRL Y-27907]
MNSNCWILSFPDEILNIIFYHLNQATTMQAMLVNKKFYQIGKVKLYRCIYVLGSQWPPLAIDAKADTSFHREFTIINTWEQLEVLYLSSRMNLVRYILCRGEQLEFKQAITENWPWIRVELEQCFDGEEESIDALKTDFTKEVIMSNYLPLEQDNYTAKSMIIENEWSVSTNILDIVPHMKGLERIEIVGRSENSLKNLKLTSKTPLHIKWLCVSLLEVDYIDYSELQRLFDLSEITSFEIHLAYLDEASEHENELQRLMKKCTNLKNLSFETTAMLFFPNIMSTLQKHSLEKLYIACASHPPLRSYYLDLYMLNQTNSLTELLVSSTTEGRWSFQEFDRVYKIDREQEEDNTQPEELKLLRDFMRESDTPHPKLRHIVLDRNHYAITNTEHGVQVDPMN